MMIKRFVKCFLASCYFLSSYNLVQILKMKNDDEYLNKEINNAKITDFKGFYFVGNNSGIPSLFWYDLRRISSKYFGIQIMNG